MSVFALSSTTLAIWQIDFEIWAFGEGSWGME